MYQYILVFLFTTLLIKYSEEKKDKYFFAILAVITISVFSGMRNLNVGTDTVSYYREFLRAQNRLGNFEALIRVDNIYNIEFSFELIAYMTAYLKNGFQILLTIYSLLTHLFIYLGIRNEYEKNKELTMWIPWLCYCFLFYNCTLNNMRQWVSIAIIFYIYSDKEKIKIERVIFYTVLAMLFHKAAIFNIYIYLLYIFCNYEFKNAKIMHIFVMLFLCGLPFVFPYFVSSIISTYISISNTRYNGFIMGNSANGEVVVDVTTLIIRSVFLLGMIGVYLNNKRREQEKYGIRFDMYCMLVDTFFAMQYNQLNLRFCNYFSVLELHNIPLGMRIYHKNKESKWIGNILLICILGIYWLTKYILWNNNETHPFHFWGG